jgi:hypothetical protein
LMAVCRRIRCVLAQQRSLVARSHCRRIPCDRPSRRIDAAAHGHQETDDALADRGG